MAKVQAVIIGGLILVGAGLMIVHERSNAQLQAERDDLQLQNHGIAVALSDVRRQRELTQGRQMELAAEQRTIALSRPNPRPQASNPTDPRLVLRVRATLSESYAGLWRELKLSPDKQQRMENLVLEKTLQEIGISHALSYGFLKGIDPNDLHAQAVLKAAATKVTDEEIRGILGDRPFATYENYAGTLACRRQIEDTAAQLKYTDAALNDGQIDRLVGFVTDASNDATALILDSLIDQAPGILNQNQVAVLKELQAERLARHQIMEMNHDAAVKGLIHPKIPSGKQLNNIL